MRGRFKKILQLIVPVLLVAVVYLSGCRKEEWNTDPAFRLSFSTDTIIFDTVFTTIGTANQILMVRNSGDVPVKITGISLARGKESPFRINIDGQSAFQLTDVEIGSHDSIFIFVKVTIDPNNHDNPLIETDSILFLTNGNQQDVKLVAWGQDALFHNNEVLKGEQVFGAGKPHVIYGDLVLDSLCTLTLNAGCRMFFHKNGSLIARSDASLRIKGTVEEPVVLRGDKLTALSKDTIPGQWRGIYLMPGSNNHFVENARILNAQVGIRLEGTIGLMPEITLYNTVIHNMTNYCLYLNHCRMEAANCQISNSGAGLVVMDNGGSYSFTHCTLADFFPFMARKYPMMYVSNYSYSDQNQLVPSPLEKMAFDNSILYGSLSEELWIDTIAQAAFNPAFRYSLVRTNYQVKYPQWFTSCIVDQDPLFVNNYKPDFTLDSISPALDAASVDIINQCSLDVTKDLPGKSRLADFGPDMGAYERQPAVVRKRK